MNISVNIELIKKYVFGNIYTYFTIVWVFVNDSIIRLFAPKLHCFGRNEINVTNI